MGTKIGLSGSRAYIDSRLLKPDEAAAYESVATIPLLGETIAFLRAI